MDTYTVEITFVIENIWPESLYGSLIIYLKSYVVAVSLSGGCNYYKLLS